jgi:dihydrofolate reductase
VRSEEKKPGEIAATSRPTPPPSRISLVVAMTKNRVIGANNRIPWHLPAEIKLFKEITMGHHMIMGRKTWESIGRLLPGRTTVVVSRSANYQVPGAIVVDTFEKALAAALGDDELMVIGGAQLFEAALPRANRIYLSVIDAEIHGDTYMPRFDLGQWNKTSSQAYKADARNPYDFTFDVYDRAVIERPATA